MTAILLDAVLLLLLIGLILQGGWELFSRSAAGLRLQQERNRRRLEQRSSLACPLHGVHPASDLVRLPSGETICPQCYLEIQNADFC